MYCADCKARQKLRSAIHPVFLYKKISSLGCPQLMSSSVTSRCILGLLGNLTSCANDTCSRCCGTQSYFINERLTSLFVVCFIQQVAGDPLQGRFTIETTLQRQRQFEIHREQQRRRQASTSISLLAQE